MASAGQDIRTPDEAQQRAVNKGLLADVFPATVDGTQRHKNFGWTFNPGEGHTRGKRKREQCKRQRARKRKIVGGSVGVGVCV